jgi:hypothetical protein
MLKKLAITCILALTAVLAVAAVGVGGSGGGAVEIGAKRSLRATDFERRASRPTSAPTGATASAVRGARLRYFTSEIFAIPAGGRDDSFMRCPRGFKAINGYFNTDGGIVEDASFSGPALRRWNFGLIDLTGVQGSAQLGIVCLKGISS